MEHTDEGLLRDARRVKVDDQAVAACWSLVLRAMEVGWVDRGELAQLLAAIQKSKDYGVQELLLEYSGGAFRVSFTGEKYECPPEDFCELLRSVLAVGHPGTITFMEDDRVISVRNVEEVPEAARFANTSKGPTPIVKVVMRMMGDKAREIVEYGPNDERLRSTVQTR